MATWNPRANDIFLDAREVRDPAARSAMVDEACRGEPELRDQVRALLAAGEQAGIVLRLPADTRPELIVAILRGLEGRPC